MNPFDLQASGSINPRLAIIQFVHILTNPKNYDTKSFYLSPISPYVLVALPISDVSDLPPALTRAEVPAKLCKRLHSAARHDMGQTGPTTSDENNVARNAYRWIRRAGVAWKIPLDVYQHKCDDGSFLDVHYIHPKKLVK